MDHQTGGCLDIWMNVQIIVGQVGNEYVIDS